MSEPSNAQLAEVSEANMLRAAKAIALCWFTNARPSPATKLAWDNCSADEQDYFLRVARAALQATQKG